MSRQLKVWKILLGTMPARIRKLPPDIANLIAAGEVVERPASVVKELVENAIDADARDIHITVKAGGLNLISVADDGVGMSRDDVVLSVERHATNKIRTAEDLAAIRTLGFRGEALPSMAAVSRLSITSKVRGSGAASPAEGGSATQCGGGTKIVVEAGAVVSMNEVGAPDGTEVCVRDLFFNVPARRKFIKGERTEFGHIHDVVEKFALAYPHIRFRLVHNEKTVLSAHACNDLRDRVAQIFGADDGCAFMGVDVSSQALKLTGLCGSPAAARVGARRGCIFVNGRPVRDRVLFHAVAEAYRTYVPRGENPLHVLFLAIDPSEVDVNVHPSKAEVRFANSGAVHDFVENAVRKVISECGMRSGETLRISDFGLRNESQEISLKYSVIANPQSSLHNLQSAFPTPQSALRIPQSSLRPLGQFAGTYLLYEGTGGTLLLVDQHAAHERIGFERLKAQYEEGGIAAQSLLVPITVELTPGRYAAIADAAETLSQIGFEVEPFGGTTVVVKSVPAILGETDIPALLAAVADDLLEHGNSCAVSERIDHVLATVACHRQVRGGDRLGSEELSALVSQMTEGVSKERCPHGRPTWIAFSERDVAKWFKRT